MSSDRRVVTSQTAVVVGNEQEEEGVEQQLVEESSLHEGGEAGDKGVDEEGPLASPSLEVASSYSSTSSFRPQCLDLRKEKNDAPSIVPNNSNHSTTSGSSINGYFHSRFDGTKRRHELLEQIAKTSPSKRGDKVGTASSNVTVTPTPERMTTSEGTPLNDQYLHSYDPHLLVPSRKSQVHSSSVVSSSETTLEPRQQSSQQESEDPPDNDSENKSPEVPLPIATVETVTKTEDDEDSLGFVSPSEIPNDADKNSPLRYYRIVYRGVVALLSEPPKAGMFSSTEVDGNEQKSGAYLSYGEIVASRSELLVEVDEEEMEKTTPSTPRRRHPSSRLGSAVSSPILSEVWERQHDQPPQSPTRSAASTVNSLPSTTSSVDALQQEDVASTAVGTTASTALPVKKIVRRMIRVDRVLTGGYAVDASAPERDSNGRRSGLAALANVKAYEMTPKRGNGSHSSIFLATSEASSMLGASPLPIADVGDGSDNPDNNQHKTGLIRPRTVATAINAKEGKQRRDNITGKHSNRVQDPLHLTLDDGNVPEAGDHFRGLGYLFLERHHLPIAILITDRVPDCERGSFIYRVISSTPLPIMTGPCLDAPKTKGILIPGSVHEVCLKVASEDGQPGAFLRLTRRRGWVASGKWSSRRGKDDAQISSKWIPTLKEIPADDGDGASIASHVSTATVASAIATPISAARRRHKPPRRRQRERTAKDVIDTVSLPRHVMGPALQSRNDSSGIADTSLNTSVQHLHNHDPRAIMSPSSNISLLSDESSLDHNKSSGVVGGGQPLTPDRSVAQSTASSSSNHPSFFLMRVNAPRGLKILDAPHFQVNNLIHGGHGTILGPTGSGGSGSHSHGHSVHSTLSPLKDMGNQSIFQTMTGQNHTTTMTSKICNPAVFDFITKARKLPRGSVFEASKRMEASGAYSQGVGLIKLSDNSGWAIVPGQDELDEQYRNYSGALAHTREGEATQAYEEVGNALSDDPHRQSSTIFLRVVSKGGLSVSLPPLPSSESDVDTSPTSSTTGSSVVSGAAGLVVGGVVSQDNSDVASSVGSSFLDAMFRTPRKNKGRDFYKVDAESKKDQAHHQQNARPPMGERTVVSTVIPCGMCVEVDRWVDPSDLERHLFKNDFARVRGGQGWIPRFVNGKPVVETVPPPEVRFGSFWFRVQDQRGIKVRLGPSRRAPSIKSDDGIYFRFECGEFLRASEVVTIFGLNSSMECFAKLYRNRHLRLHTGLHGEVRSLASLTVQAEWVQVFGDGSLFLDECGTEPRIERHRQGWRYNVVLDARVSVRKGPSFAAETDGVILLGGESVLVNERVTGPDESITWLRLKDCQGWVHTVGPNREVLMIPHSIRHRADNSVTSRPTKVGRPRSGQEEIAYNTIIARLFHNDVPSSEHPPRTSSSFHRPGGEQGNRY